MARSLPRDAQLGVEGTTVRMGPTTDGRQRVCGGPRLKESQAYPEGYGRAVHDYWQQHYITNAGDSDGEDSVASSVSDTDYVQISTEHGEIDDACQQLGVNTTVWRC